MKYIAFLSGLFVYKITEESSILHIVFYHNDETRILTSQKGPRKITQPGYQTLSQELKQCMYEFLSFVLKSKIAAK